MYFSDSSLQIKNFRCQINYATQTTIYWSIYTYIKKKKGIRKRRATGSKAEKARVRTAQARTSETVEKQRKARLEANRVRTAQARSSETVEQREVRLKKKLDYAILKHCRLKQYSNGKQDWKPLEYALLELDEHYKLI